MSDLTTAIDLDGFARTEFTALGATRTVYRAGDGPPVLVMHEIPGIIPEVAAFARRVAADGFHVVMPNLFGTPGKPFSLPYAVGQVLRACISREFRMLGRRQASPITEWLRALCRRLHEEHGGAGVGAVGMCLTGNFALALMVDPWLMAPVLSQPSLPLPLTGAHRNALHVSDEALVTIRRRAAEEGAGVLGLRFTNDPSCPPERFRALQRELGDGFEGIEIDSARGNAHGIGSSAHSVLTRELVDEAGHPTKAALDRVLALFHERLRAPDSAARAPSPSQSSS